MSTPYTGQRSHYGASDEIKKVYWNIGEVSEMFSITNSNLRFWLREFDLEVSRVRGMAHERRFTQEDIEKIKEIHRLLRIELYTIEGAKRKFKQGSQINRLRG